MNRIVLAYSGGFASSVAIPWLAERYGAEVVTLTLDLGQARELAAVRERALSLGAVRAHVIDAREEFVGEFVRPALQAGAFAADDPLAPSALARPLIARRLLEIARMESASIVAHAGAPAAGEDALHRTVLSIAGSVPVVSVAREWGMHAASLADYARAHDVHVPPPEPARLEANLWGRVVYAADGMLPEDAFTLTRPASDAPEAAAFVDIEFAAGTPVRANGVEMPFVEMIESLETIAGAHGVGRSALVVASHGAFVIESPASAVLAIAQRELEQAVLGADLAEMKQQLGTRYARLVASGEWFSDLREAIDAFVRILQPRLTGAVRVRLHKGECVVVDRQSPHAVPTAASNPRAVA